MIEPDDVVRAADYVVDALGPAPGRDWSVRAGRLEWDVDHTLTHLTGGPGKYAMYLASRSSRFIAVRLDRWPDATQVERLDAVGGVARALATVAAAAPPGTRAYHTSGMVDASGFVAMACIELLVHGHDIAEGLDLPFGPPDDLCRSVVARLFPWFSDGATAWDSILRHTGRMGPPGDDTWRALTIPLDEWDGNVPQRDPRTVIAWVADDAGAWQPQYHEES